MSKQAKTLLIIDDDKVLCDVVRDHFASRSVEVLVAHSGAEAHTIYQKRKVDVTLLDQKLPDVEGYTLCPSILQHNEQAKIIFITAHPSFESAVKAIRSGAYDYLSKPFDLEELNLAVEKAFRTIKLENIEQLQNYRIDRKSEQTVLIGGNGALAETMRLVDLAASVDSPVLITGETGTGKNLVAEAIHYKSPAHSAAFISVNCASLPENLIEAELFGYEKGAFTSAVTARKGIFEMAEGGTLLLDEIGEIPLHLQSKLLSVLEEKKIRRLGGESINPVEVRIIASTSIPLETALGNSFRKDLYYRLNVIRIHIPPLRERRDDIPELCTYLLKKIAGGHEVNLPDSETEKMKEYDWPGNVRELRNILERAFILHKGSVLQPSELLSTAVANSKPFGPAFRGIRPEPFDSTVRPEPVEGGTVPLRTGSVEALIPLMEMEKKYIKHALDNLSHNYTQTAKSLGISLSTLKRKIKEYGLK
jgi:DNA-binding NtrC family response regulator